MFLGKRERTRFLSFQACDIKFPSLGVWNPFCWPRGSQIKKIGHKFSSSSSSARRDRPKPKRQEGRGGGVGAEEGKEHVRMMLGRCEEVRSPPQVILKKWKTQWSFNISRNIFFVRIFKGFFSNYAPSAQYFFADISVKGLFVLSVLPHTKYSGHIFVKIG